MTEPHSCPTCGAPLTEAELHGLCAKCLGGEAGLEPDRKLFPDTKLPRAFGDYELLEELGRGGMGIVYKARQKSLNREVAIKMLLDGPLANLASAGRFRREAAAAAQLRHPNIAAIHEINERDGLLYFSMDYIRGVSLADLARRRPLPVETSVKLLKTLAEAIEFAHQRGTIHRDLKPSNVILDEQGQPHVLDFGLAKRIEARGDFTLTGQTLGSPGYAPPEQVDAKHGRMGTWSDVYGLGAILYFLLTGRAPFVGDSLPETLYQTIKLPPKPLRSINPEVPAVLEAICLKCLEKNPADRYQSAGELADELGQSLSGQPKQIGKPRTHRQIALWGRRNPATGWAISLGLVGILVGGAWILWRTTAPEKSRPPKIAESAGLVQPPIASTLVAATNADRNGDFRASSLFIKFFSPEYGDCGLVSVNGVVSHDAWPLIWNWGDGTTNQGGFPASHQYASNGTYVVTLTAFGGAGETKSAAETVTISNVLVYVIPDPKGNLEGDTNRTFLDLEEVSLRAFGSNYLLEFRVVGPFPAKAEMAGGRRFDFMWFADADGDTTTTQVPGLGNDYNVNIHFDARGWLATWYKVSPFSTNDGIQIDQDALVVQASSNRVSLLFPQTYLPSRNFEFWAYASTQNAPDWRPFTFNPLTKRKRADF